jgi:uncharacterized protein (DUF2345 family)
MSKGCFYHRTPGEEELAATTSSATSAAPQPGQYDEQFTLLDGAYRPLSNARYRIVTDSGRAFTGTTDAAGQTQRVVSQGSSGLRLQLEKQ